MSEEKEERYRIKELKSKKERKKEGKLERND